MIFLRRIAHVVSILVLLTCAACAAAAQSRSNPQDPSSHVGHGSEANQRPAQPPINITVTVPKKDPAELQQEAADRNAEIDTQRSIAKFNLWLVLVGAAQAFAMVLGLYITNKAANAARDSAKFAERALHISERAHLGFGNWSIQTPLWPADLRIDFSLINSGRTPATLFESGFAFLIHKDPPPTPVYIQAHIKDEGNTPINPAMPVSRPTNIANVSAEDRLAVFERKTKRLWYWGYFRYRDVFGLPHFSQFLSVWEDGKMVQYQSTGFNAAD